MAQRFGFSLSAVFIASSRRSPSVPKPAKQNGGQFGDHGSIGDFSPIAFSGHPRGPRVGSETMCPRHTAPNLPAETSLSNQSVSRTRRPPPEKIPSMERTRSETLKLFVVSDVGRRSTLLSSTQSTRWWQSSGPRSDAPFLAACPWPVKPRRTPETDRVCSKPRSPHP